MVIDPLFVVKCTVPELWLWLILGGNYQLHSQTHNGIGERTRGIGEEGPLDVLVPLLLKWLLPHPSTTVHANHRLHKQLQHISEMDIIILIVHRSIPYCRVYTKAS